MNGMRRLLLPAAVLLFSTLSVHSQTVICESMNGTYRECRVGTSGPIRLVMEMSDRACFEGATWGTRSVGVVWVDRGCRGRFGPASSATSAPGGRSSTRARWSNAG